MENEAPDMAMYLMRTHCEKPLLKIGNEFRESLKIYLLIPALKRGNNPFFRPQKSDIE